MIVRDPIVGIVIGVMILAGFWFGIETRTEVRSLHDKQGLIIDKTSNKFKTSEYRTEKRFESNEAKSDFLIEQVRKRLSRIEDRNQQMESRFDKRLYRLEQIVIDNRLLIFDDDAKTHSEVDNDDDE